jgi:hypothetical protein
MPSQKVNGRVQENFFRLGAFTAFAVRKNIKRELLFFLTAAREAGLSPLGSKAVNLLRNRR